MATKRKTPTTKTKKAKRLHTLEHYKSSEDDHDQNEITIPLFPDLVIDKILRLLPTTLVIRASILSKQWMDVWSSVPVIDFDEGKPYDNDINLEKLRRRKFLKFLRGCLKLREKDKSLDKFRLHMRYCGKGTSIDKWLSFAIERSVKELDISLERKSRFRYYCLSKTLLNAKSITTLNLEGLRIKNENTHQISISLPSLKTMSLKTVDFGYKAFSLLILGCPKIEFLSLTSSTLTLWLGKTKVSFCTLESL